MEADDEDLADLQALDAWDAENDRRATHRASVSSALTQRPADERAKGAKHSPEERTDSSEDDEADEEDRTLRKDSMDHGGLAEALGRARALHSIRLR